MTDVLDKRTEKILMGSEGSYFGIGDIIDIFRGTKNYREELEALQKTPLTDLSVINERLDSIEDLVNDTKLRVSLDGALTYMNQMVQNLGSIFEKTNEYVKEKKDVFFDWMLTRLAGDISETIQNMHANPLFDALMQQNNSYKSKLIPKLVQEYQTVRESPLVQLYQSFSEEIKPLAGKLKEAKEKSEDGVKLEDFDKIFDPSVVLKYKQQFDELGEKARLQSDWTRDVFIHVELAKEAVENKYVRPEIVSREENILFIENGRMKVFRGQEYVPNDTNLDPEHRVEVLEGPNASGKTMDMKKTFYIAARALAGCYVPASSAKVSIRDKIILREKGTGDATSAFFMDCMSAQETFAPKGEYWLVGMDESFTSTERRGGEALSYGLIKYHRDNQNTLLVMSSHYPSLSQAFADDPTVQFNHFTFEKQTSGNRLNVSFPYKKESGPLTDFKYAIAVAETTGFDTYVIKYAKERMEQK